MEMINWWIRELAFYCLKSWKKAYKKLLFKSSEIFKIFNLTIQKFKKALVNFSELSKKSFFQNQLISSSYKSFIPNNRFKLKGKKIELNHVIKTIFHRASEKNLS
jgi:hypothetical protein